MKMREELETVVGDGEVLLRVLEGARPPRLVPLREVPRGVRARGRDRRDRRNAGRRVRRDRGQRARHRRDGRGARPQPSRLHPRLVPRPVPPAPRGVRPRRSPTWCSTSRMPAADRRAPRALAADRRPRHPPAAAHLRPRQGRRPVNGEPLVRRVIRWLAAAGIRDSCSICIIGPRRSPRVVGDGSDLGVRVRYSWEQPVLGSAGGPRHALPLLVDARRRRFLIVNGDTLTDVDIWRARSRATANRARS